MELVFQSEGESPLNRILLNLSISNGFICNSKRSTRNKCTVELVGPITIFSLNEHRCCKNNTDALHNGKETVVRISRSDDMTTLEMYLFLGYWEPIFLQQWLHSRRLMHYILNNTIRQTKSPIKWQEQKRGIYCRHNSKETALNNTAELKSLLDSVQSMILKKVTLIRSFLKGISEGGWSSDPLTEKIPSLGTATWKAFLSLGSLLASVSEGHWGNISHSTQEPGSQDAATNFFTVNVHYRTPSNTSTPFVLLYSPLAAPF